jgi:hypothetical protein
MLPLHLRQFLAALPLANTCGDTCVPTPASLHAGIRGGAYASTASACSTMWAGAPRQFLDGTVTCPVTCCEQPPWSLRLP